jgi:hypothetical protein
VDLLLVLGACGRIVTTLWIVAAILVASGIYAIVRRERVPGISLIVAGILVGPAGVTIACWARRPGGRIRQTPAGSRPSWSRIPRSISSRSMNEIARPTSPNSRPTGAPEANRISYTAQPPSNRKARTAS